MKGSLQDRLVSALKGCMDALESVPEGRRGNHDSNINRALRRAEKALEEHRRETMRTILEEHRRETMRTIGSV